VAQSAHPPAVLREVAHHVFRDRPHSAGIEDHEVRQIAWPRAAAERPLQARP
jgi:hypothetical protein